MLSVFCSPTRYTQGKNATAALGAEMTAIGLQGPALIVASRRVANLLGPTWKSSLAAENISYGVHHFTGECCNTEIERVKARACDLSARTIIGAGGGKVLDTARAAASDLHLPIVNCPTIASSDAPCSALSVVYTDEGVFEEYRIYPQNPDLVLVDTAVIAQAPARLLSAGMGDALATWFEARTCAAGSVRNMRGGASTRSALGLAELCYRTLLADGTDALAAVAAGSVTPALERLVEANTLLSGLGFESAGLAAAHAVHNGLTVAPETHDFYHGEKVAFGTLVQLVLEGAPHETIAEVLTFSRSVNLPITLNQIGLRDVTRESLLPIAGRAAAPGETIHNEPFEVVPENVVDAILTADAVGRDFIKQRTGEAGENRDVAPGD
ncbi:glycerol dehydrogenase [Mycobacterium sp. SM1]|uniref:glycerol dehydrogenase n=1 Tax=Mycobacterium sp. SM1 TaxID=2816243 RepID=UPI001BCF394A|nr:glycerol dehydrogenase [Mycobacterium sp. SM1]MBS4729052.1 glycerol dehydrogenase [Mycobacterium sp. SM1]